MPAKHSLFSTLRFAIYALVFAALVSAPQAIAAETSRDQQAPSIDALKQDIINLATSYKGQGDPDFSKQRALEPLIAALLARAPQPPVKERLPLLHGVWKQVWGPYDYRGNDRGIDPALDPDAIYQVVFRDGYYYNVTPLTTGANDDGKRIALLRGEYKLGDGKDLLRIRFTRYPGNRGLPDGMRVWELAALAEARDLPNKITIVPSIIVKLFFGGGQLEEVYTDETLRIAYGGSKKDGSDRYVYIMARVKE